MARREDFLSICELAGAHVIDAGKGWPGRAQLALRDGTFRELLIHAGPLTSHARGIAGEVRLQPPGLNCPVQDDPAALPLIVGIDQTKMLIAVDAYRHVGRNERWTVTFRDNLVTEAVQYGWAATERPVNPGGIEYIYAFRPAFLPIYVEMIARGVTIAPTIFKTAIIETGFAEAPNDTAATERARQMASRIVRDAAFSKDVREAYDNKCALCGLGLGLVVGAHVLPASAPGSPDEVRNGICLCENHHRAFDGHLIYVEPESLAVRLHPQVHAEAANDAAAAAFVSGTRATLRFPNNPAFTVDTTMLIRRYQYFVEFYDWVQ